MKFKQIELNEKNNVGIDVYQSNSDEPLPGIVIVPGGSYQPFFERDSERVAMKFVTQGFQAFVARYPIGKFKNYAAAKESLKDMFTYLTDNADKLLLDPQKLGIIGFSAGGQIAAAYADSQKTKAKFAILGYPVITPTLDDKMGIKSENVADLVTEQTPPTFVFGAQQDQLTPFNDHILPYVHALSENNVLFELHEFATGNHGMALADHYTAVVNRDREDQHFASWFNLSIDWLNETFQDN